MDPMAAIASRHGLFVFPTERMVPIVPSPGPLAHKLCMARDAQLAGRIPECQQVLFVLRIMRRVTCQANDRRIRPGHHLLPVRPGSGPGLAPYLDPDGMTVHSGADFRFAGIRSVASFAYPIFAAHQQFLFLRPMRNVARAAAHCGISRSRHSTGKDDGGGNGVVALTQEMAALPSCVAFKAMICGLAGNSQVRNGPTVDLECRHVRRVACSAVEAVVVCQWETLGNVDAGCGLYANGVLMSRSDRLPGVENRSVVAAVAHRAGSHGFFRLGGGIQGLTTGLEHGALRDMAHYAAPAGLLLNRIRVSAPQAYRE